MDKNEERQQQQAAWPIQEPYQEGDRDDSPTVHFPGQQQKVAHMLGGSSTYESKCEYNMISKEVLSIMQTNPLVLKWTKIMITFN